MKKLLLLFLFSHSLYAMNKNNADLEKEKRVALEQNIRRAFLAQLASKEKSLGFTMDKDKNIGREETQEEKDRRWYEAFHYDWHSTEKPIKKQKIEQSINSINYFSQLPQEIIMHIFCFAMPVLQNKEQCKNENWEEKKVFDMPEEFFASDLPTYKNVFETCKKFKQLLKDDIGIVNLMQYLKERKQFKLLRKNAIPASALWADDWEASDW